MIPFVDEFRDKKIIGDLLNKIHAGWRGKINIMEVCGGHTMAIRRYGLPGLLPEGIRLISGPGCPVCVTSRSFIDKLVQLAKIPGTITATFGDLIRVPGSASSLEKEKSLGQDIRIIFSPLDAIELAKQNPEKRIIFPGIGFETTAPGSATAIIIASQLKLKNFFVLSAHKTMPAAMETLVSEEHVIDAFLAPGHVCTVTGTGDFTFLSEKYNLPVVISGFEPIDILQSVLMIINQKLSGSAKTEIQYKRLVAPEGNAKAIKNMQEVFVPADDWWRGLGIIKGSGLSIAGKYKKYDADNLLEYEVEPSEPKGCRCGEVLQGKIRPVDCKLFGKVCQPENPVGACMVSSEGACQAWYRY